mmetsp:Transcript_112977/g.326415  ORF Transcript_112977/g.326415 Transcript_112977/m.326415 type:complete len:250 (+) Transcript_112977:280-1029(+)
MQQGRHGGRALRRGARQHPHDQIHGLGVLLESGVGEVDLGDLQASSDLLHLRAAHPVLAWAIVEHAVLERKPAAKQSIGDDANREDVGQGRVATSVRLLRDVLVCADDVPAYRGAWRPLLQRVEVDHLHMRTAIGVIAGAAQHDVLQLQVLVHGVVGVHVHQGDEQTPQDALRRPLVHLAGLQGLEHVEPINPLHDDVKRSRVFDDLVELGNTGVGRHAEEKLGVLPPAPLVLPAPEALRLEPKLHHYL